MSVPTADPWALLAATWPAARLVPCGPFTLRDGRGGGQRVSAATAVGLVTDEEIARAEAGMQAMEQSPLFMIRGEAVLDAALAERGYTLADPVVIYTAPVAELALPPQPLSAFAHWEPLAITREIWAAAGVDAPRQAVMDRVGGPKAAILGRSNNCAAGAAFVALHGEAAMLHAVEVVPTLRRLGTARNMLRAAAVWARGAGAQSLLLAVTEANAPARALYDSLGMRIADRYHYRRK